MVKQITIYSTCQGEGISHYLKHYFPEDNFNVIRNYNIVLSNQPNEIESFINLLTNTNIFIYQQMPMKWGIYSTDLSVENNLLSYLPNNCIKIVIPYVFADWYWGLKKHCYGIRHMNLIQYVKNLKTILNIIINK